MVTNISDYNMVCAKAKNTTTHRMAKTVPNTNTTKIVQGLQRSKVYKKAHQK